MNVLELMGLLATAHLAIGLGLLATPSIRDDINAITDEDADADGVPREEYRALFRLQFLFGWVGVLIANSKEPRP